MIPFTDTNSLFNLVENEEGVIKPKDIISHFYPKYNDNPDAFKIPERTIICFNPSLKNYFKGMYPNAKKHPSHSGWIIEEKDYTVGVFFSRGFGAPMSALLIEELIFLGGRCFITVGAAGYIGEKDDIGQLVLVDKSLRGEGTSQYYQKKGLFSYPHLELNHHIDDYLKSKEINISHVSTWATASVYRETPSLLDALVKNKVKCIDMESSAMFSIAQYRGIPLSVLFYLTDCFHDLMWEPFFTDEKSISASEKLLGLAIDFISQFDINVL